jgi:regulator of sirC expression with transglutaminase-like and TPR domain
VLDACRLLDATGAFDRSCTTTEQAAIMAPRQMLHLQRLRSPALRCGDLALALMSAQTCLAAMPWEAAHHRNLAQVYRAMGDERMAGLRTAMADLLDPAPVTATPGP